MRSAPQLAGALALGSVAGGLVIVNPAATLAAAAALGALLVLGRGFSALGSQRLAGMAWAGAAFTAPLNGLRVSSPVAVSDVFLVVAVVATVAAMVVRGRSPFRFPAHEGVLVGIVLLVSGGALGTLFAAQPVASLTGIAKFALAAAGSVLAVQLWAPSARQVRWFCSLWLGGAVVSSLWALTFAPKLVGRPLGFSTHPNHLGMVCLLATAIALGHVLSGRSPFRKTSMLSLPLLLVVLVASGSRAALLGLLVMVPAVAVLSHRVELVLAAGAVAAVLAVAVLAGVVRVPAQSGLGRLIGEGSTPATYVGRIDQLSKSVDRFQRHPLTGEGFEFAQEAHNIYLQVLVAAGPLGLLGLAVVAGSVLGLSVTGIRARTGRVSGDRALLAGLGGGYVGYLAAGLFQNILWDRYLWLYVASAISLAASLRTGTAELLSPPEGRGNRPRPPVRLLAASRGDGPSATRPIPESGWSR